MRIKNTIDSEKQEFKVRSQNQVNFNISDKIHLPVIDEQIRQTVYLVNLKVAEESGNLSFPEGLIQNLGDPKPNVELNDRLDIFYERNKPFEIVIKKDTTIKVGNTEKPISEVLIGEIRKEVIKFFESGKNKADDAPAETIEFYSDIKKIYNLFLNVMGIRWKYGEKKKLVSESDESGSESEESQNETEEEGNSEPNADSDEEKKEKKEKEKEKEKKERKKKEKEQKERKPNTKKFLFIGFETFIDEEKSGEVMVDFYKMQKDDYFTINDLAKPSSLLINGKAFQMRNERDFLKLMQKFLQKGITEVKFLFVNLIVSKSMNIKRIHAIVNKDSSATSRHLNPFFNFGLHQKM